MVPTSRRDFLQTRPTAVRSRPSLLLFLIGALLGSAGSTPSAPAAEAGPRTAQDYARDLESADRKLRREAAYELSRLGKEAKVALPQLIAALDDEQQQVWFGAITALTNLGPDAEAALPALLRELRAWQPFRKDRQGSQALYRTALALGAIGAPAIPALIEELKSESWFVRAGAARALGFAAASAASASVPLASLLSDERVEVREAAEETLSALGGAALGPVSETLRSAREPRARLAAAETLRRLGKAAAPAGATLRTRFREESQGAVKAAILQALVRIELSGPEAVEWLMAARHDATTEVREMARQELLLVRPASTTVVPALVAELTQAQRTNRLDAARLLTHLGEASAGAVPALIQALRAPGADAEERRTMALAVAATGPAAWAPLVASVAGRDASSLTDDDWEIRVVRGVDITALPALTEALGAEDDAARVLALEGLTVLADRVRPVPKALTPLLEHRLPAIRARAWTAAAAVGVVPELLLTRLDAALTDASPAVRRAAVRSLGPLGKAAAPAVEKLVKLLPGAEAELRTDVLSTLGRLGVEAAAAVPALAERLRAVGDAERGPYLRVLGEIGAPAAAEMRAMLDVSTSTNAPVRAAFAMAVRGLGKEGKDAAARLLELLRDAEPSVRAAAALGLAAVAPEAESTVTALGEALEDSSADVRSAAAQAVARLEERGRPTEKRLFALLSSEADREAAKNALKAIRPVGVDALIGCLDHLDWGVREMAADGLGRLGKDATNAIPALEKALREDRQEEVKRASRRALRRIRES